MMSKLSCEDASPPTDVVVVGGGIVGLLTALQLDNRGLRVTLIDDIAKRRTEKRYKVGESLLIFSNPVCRVIGEMQEFCTRSHPKQGLWFTWGMEHERSFEGATEYAFSGGKPPQSWIDAMVSRTFYDTMASDVHISRPEAEEHLVEVASKRRGITLVDDALVKNISISKTGPHRVEWANDAGTKAIPCRWVVDCAGRKRILAKQMGHVADEKEFGDGLRTAAVWGHFERVKDEMFDDWVLHLPDGVPEERDKFTLHLWGDGYWIWVIRLNEERLSLGICFDRAARIPGKSFREKFWEVIRRYPIFDGIVSEENMVQFSSYNELAYVTDTCVSGDRYAILGDAASSVDAFYSQGMSINLALSWHAVNIIEDDVRGRGIDAAYVKRINEHSVNDWQMIRSTIVQKYTRAISDSRFFVMSHFFDLLMLSAITLPRHRFARWLLETEGGKLGETASSRRLKESMSKDMFYSAAYPYLSLLGPRFTSNALHWVQGKMAARALWRLDNGIEVPRARFIFRFYTELPRLWRLFGRKEAKPLVELSPPLLTGKEPAFLHITGTEDAPILLLIGTRVVLPALLGGFFLMDALDTGLAKLRAKAASRRSRGAPRVERTSTAPAMISKTRAPTVMHEMEVSEQAMAANGLG